MLGLSCWSHRMGCLLALGVVALLATVTSAQTGSSIPSQAYYLGIEELYQGEYRDAVRILRRERDGSVKTVSARWIDLICYSAMLGETYYHQGRIKLALEQYTLACNMVLQYPKWMLRVKFDRPPRPDTNIGRRVLTWGRSERRSVFGNLPSTMLIGLGRIDNSDVARGGGVLVQAQLWRVNVTEIVRCTALAIQRRSELLGPLAVHDEISKRLVQNLSRGAAPPNHWSGAWISLQLGLAQAGLGQNEQALRNLGRAVLLQGKYDHSLTCVALLEQGRLNMKSGNSAAAAQLFAEAGFSAFYYENFGVLDESFRLGSINHLVASVGAPNPALVPAASWARRKRLDHIFTRISLARCEELMASGNWNEAAAALRDGTARLRDIRTGVLGNRAQFLDARLQYQSGSDTAPASLASAVEGRKAMSPHNLQIALANSLFDSQQLLARSASAIYSVLLADPAPGDWLFRPLDSLAVMKTPHGAAFERWIAALLARKNLPGVLEVTDLAKRHRYHSYLPWGGRLAALRGVLETPETQLTGQAVLQRNELLLKYPQYALDLQTGQELRAELRTRWLAGMDAKEQRSLVRTWRNYAENIGDREALLPILGLDRVAADLSFPPRLSASDLKSNLKPGQAVLVFHDTSQGMLGFLVTSRGSTHWNCGPSGRLSGPISKFLRDLGNYDANRQMTTEQLLAGDWLVSGAKLFGALLEDSSIDPESITELIVVPDGVVWYVPMAGLPATTEDRTAPLISFCQIRTVPTFSLALPGKVPHRRVQRSVVVGGKMVPGDTKEDQAEALAEMRDAVENPIELPSPLPVGSPTVASMLESLVVLDDIDIELSSPLGWSPLPGGRPAGRGALGKWLSLPQAGPQRIILPGTHTIAERGGKTPKRRGIGGPPGSELFLSSCALMASGAETVLLSRWRVGGQSSLNLIREFIQELPHTSAADAWQRSVQLAAETPIDPAEEMRVKKDKQDTRLTAAHPFFWSGYLLIDRGHSPSEKEDPEADKP